MSPSVTTAPALDRVAAIYREHVDFVWRSARGLGASPASADDIAQEVFIVAARKLDEAKDPRFMRSWLFAIAMRVAANRRRSDARHQRKLEEAVRCAAALESDGGALPLSRQEAVQTLHGLLQRLDDPHRAVYVLMELEGMTAFEAANALGVNANTVYTRLRTARERLRKIVDRIKRQEGHSA